MTGDEGDVFGRNEGSEYGNVNGWRRRKTGEGRKGKSVREDGCDTEVMGM